MDEDEKPRRFEGLHSYVTENTRYEPLSVFCDVLLRLIADNGVSGSSVLSHI